MAHFLAIGLLAAGVVKLVAVRSDIKETM